MENKLSKQLHTHRLSCLVRVEVASPRYSNAYSHTFPAHLASACLVCIFNLMFLLKWTDTTRAPRKGEEEGKDYHFVTRDTFEQMVISDKTHFLEHATFGGNMYGTTIKAVRDVAERNQICILDIDRWGFL